MKRSTSSWRSVSSVMAGSPPEHRYTGTAFRRQESTRRPRGWGTAARGGAGRALQAVAQPHREAQAVEVRLGAVELGGGEVGLRLGVEPDAAPGGIAESEPELEAEGAIVVGRAPLAAVVG